ncbi:MAG: hypothetical protein Q8Q56_00300 [Alphaproteobacteria bacterium]|nr:hypothetical protein [Alphaproteobacteria bacterium]
MKFNQLLRVCTLLTITTLSGSHEEIGDSNRERQARSLLMKEEALTASEITELNKIVPTLSDQALEMLSSSMSETKLKEIMRLLAWGRYMAGVFEEDPNFPLLRLYAPAGSCVGKYMLAGYLLDKGEYEKAALWYVRSARDRRGTDARWTLSRLDIDHLLLDKSLSDEDIAKVFVEKYRALIADAPKPTADDMAALKAALDQAKQFTE